MDRKIAIPGAVLLAVCMVGALLFVEVRAQRERNAGLLARVAELESARLSATSVALPTALPASAPQTDANRAPDAPGPVTAAATAPATESNDIGALVRQMMDSEEGREATRSMSVMALKEQYPDLEKALGLTEGQAQQLIDLLARHRVEMGMDRMTLANTPGSRAAAEQLARSLSEKNQAQEGEVAALLGEKYMQWKDYQRTAATRQREQMQRRQVEQLRRAVSAPGRPVSDAQFSSLRAALQDEEQRIQVESRGLGLQQQAARMSDDHNRMLEVASVHLDPVQLESYRRHLQQQADMMRMMTGALGGLDRSTAASPDARSAPASATAD